MLRVTKDGVDICAVGKHLGTDSLGKSLQTGDQVIIMEDGVPRLTVAITEHGGADPITLAKSYYSCINNERCGVFQYKELVLDEVIVSKANQIASLSVNCQPHRIIELAKEIIHLMEN